MDTTAARTGNPALDGFVADLVEIARSGATELALTAAVAARLKALLEASLELTPGQRRPDRDRYAMYPLWVAADGGLSVASAVWSPGQTTPIHDHGAWGVIGIVDGCEREVRYRPPPADTKVAPIRLEERLHKPGDVTICCTSDQDVHQVSCASDVPCVAVHVYGTDIGSCRRRAYDPQTGEVSWFVSEWAPIVD